jgi:Na+/H+-dicarboxylate symporter
MLSLDKAVFGATGLGLLTGYYAHPTLMKLAGGVAQVFVNLLQLISLPIIFCSIVATLANMQSMAEMKTIGRKIVFYTLLTTLIAAALALLLYQLINPLHGLVLVNDVSGVVPGVQSNYLQFVLDIIPSNAMEALSSNHKVLSVVFIAVGFGLAILSLKDEDKKPLQDFFRSLFAAVLKITTFVMYATPFGVWAFMSKFMHEMQTTTANLELVGWYVVCVIAANIVQGFVVLPLLLWFKGINPVKSFHGMMPALMTAFFSKSSNIALPFSMKCAQNNLKVSKKVSSIAFPLCSVINMNGCAAFILLTVLFVGSQSGIAFTLFDQWMWVFIATIAAVGNAGVPMGCFFLSTALLTGMGAQVDLMLLILPIYALIDMVETTLNVWSDSCVALIVDRDLKVD